ncbi:hypothetical protein A3B48_03560 [Candidatus Gottesmanbacteria bacterium RIFCSPLOWO2_01_FULL_40_10]|uniref:Glutaredoxin domain-containing protein n=1 Tax=Candidatus Gottesmanbacteria bacterium RIFCSPHIGHO2_01_FULL_40_15 TaxID=1798376 RepID=A0A1F5Z0Z4_9BACT|nr:MAG: hypothetical protein A2777_02535 [Candidatus Gottesmanbacteria bacterium RIFCSPHIGHO2_01_FULL_40_15]OGG21748.1 MAG: hypothetical protein A3B48_03560 [Candidatus Gottesmanbacteria bacterium RIFCSPLOWO2_01_FULL_40_10]OGG32000.1 MAG: hypothetical protein A3I80_05020 [Candidatus Gottesmanbacteria bacterium RIFCSPLOWO2_02_FULL_40_10]
MFRKITIFILLLILFLTIIPSKSFSQNNITVHFFRSEGCPHCAKEEVFLEKLKVKYPDLEIRDYEISQNRNNAELLQKTGKELAADVSGVPFTVVGRHYTVGFGTEETSGRIIEEMIMTARNNNEPDVVSLILNNNAGNAINPAGPEIPFPVSETISLPILGTVAVSDLSLPVLTFVIALTDGFNPCAMWVLIFLISLLIGMHDRFKMLALGSVFILASGAVYFLFLSAWLNVFLFLGFIVWIRSLIGGVALIAGGFNLREYFTNRDGACHVTAGEKRRRIFDRLREITKSRNFLISVGGIILLAFAVNLVELVCSAGLPAVYTKVLTLSNLPVWKYYIYLLFYVFIFMLDDLIVFFAAVTTLHITGINTKYTRFSHLLGGIGMVIIGLLMIFKPEILMFL